MDLMVLRVFFFLLSNFKRCTQSSGFRSERVAQWQIQFLATSLRLAETELKQWLNELTVDNFNTLQTKCLWIQIEQGKKRSKCFFFKSEAPKKTQQWKSVEALRRENINTANWVGVLSAFFSSLSRLVHEYTDIVRQHILNLKRFDSRVQISTDTLRTTSTLPLVYFLRYAATNIKQILKWRPSFSSFPFFFPAVVHAKIVTRVHSTFLSVMACWAALLNRLKNGKIIAALINGQDNDVDIDLSAYFLSIDLKTLFNSTFPHLD